MRVYVAGKFEEKEAVRAMQNLLRADGHGITHDWTQEDATGKTPEQMRPYLASCALGDALGVLMCEAFVLLHHDRLAGGLVEMGIAIGNRQCRHIIVVGASKGAVRPIFYDLLDVHHVETAEEARDLLAKRVMAEQRVTLTS